MRRWAAGIVVVGLVLGGCGDDDGGDVLGSELEGFLDAAADAEPCDEVFADGRATDDALAEYDERPCTDEDGEIQVYAVASYDCDDGRTLSFFDLGYGFSGDEWHRYAPGEDPALPPEVFAACKP